MCTNNCADYCLRVLPRDEPIAVTKDINFPEYDRREEERLGKADQGRDGGTLSVMEEKWIQIQKEVP